MAEPKRIDDETTPSERTAPNVEERRPPSRDSDTRRPLLHNEPARRAESDPVLLPEDSEAARPPANTGMENRAGATQAERERNTGATAEQPMSLFADADINDYRSRWGSIQTAFVDEPRKAVEDADNLVKSVLNKLSDSFTQERQTLANQWGRGDNVSTEDLRITLRRYRSFFDRLLSV